MNSKFLILYMVLMSSLFISSCQDFLDAKPDQSILVPSSLNDLQAILDNNAINSQYPYIGEAGADNYYLTDTRFNALIQIARSIYIWDQNVFSDVTSVNDWNRPYYLIACANVVLEGLQKLLEKKEESDYKHLQGHALFIRSYQYFLLSQLFCKPYNKETASTDLGIPLRLNADINDRPNRGTLKQIYDQIIHDLVEAEKLLPAEIVYRTRPNKSAANALLSRVYLIKGDYDNALQYANNSLAYNNSLMDYNSLSISETFPFRQLNEEVLFHASVIPSAIFTFNSYYVDSLLYSSYDENDLRKTLLFNNSDLGVVFKGSYVGNTLLFSGIANNEVYLTRAECYVRKGEVNLALDDLNTLLINRWKSDRFEVIHTTNPAELLDIILSERRKELIFSNIRWSDLRRLNLLDPSFAKNLTRFIENQVYVLPPNDVRYVYPLPQDEIDLTGIEQNQR